MVRVYMLSQMPLFSQGIETLLCQEEGVEIVGRASNLVAALAQVKSLCPDVVILDMALQAGDLASVAALIFRAHANTLVVAMSLEGNNVTLFREEQRTVHKIKDLMRAISNGLYHSDSLSTKA